MAQKKKVDEVKVHIERFTEDKSTALLALVRELGGFDAAIEWLGRAKVEDEKMVAFMEEVKDAYPLDGLVALSKALAKLYGWTDLRPTPGFFGDTPPTMIGVWTSKGGMIQVPYGRIAMPAFDGHLDTQIVFKPVPKFVIAGQAKKKHLPQVQAIVDEVHRILRDDSIYRGQAVKCSWEWERNGIAFSPTDHCPKFMDLNDTVELIFSEDVQRALDINLFTPIEKSEQCRLVGIPLKRGALAEGAYGTGKTELIRLTALKAAQNGWTFIYLDSVLDLPHGIELARMYQPAIIAAEDIDRVAGTELELVVRNALDSIEAKGTEIITVFTTNHVEKLDKRGLLRPGRMDTVVSVRPPDATAAGRLVELYGRGLVSPEIDLYAVGRSLQGQIPAVIREVVERSKLAAVARTGLGNIIGYVDENDILAAVESMKEHQRLLAGTVEERKDMVVSVRLPGYANGHNPDDVELLAAEGLRVREAKNDEEHAE